jgi:hypothetical protein
MLLCGGCSRKNQVSGFVGGFRVKKDKKLPHIEIWSSKNRFSRFIPHKKLFFLLLFNLNDFKSVWLHNLIYIPPAKWS